MFTFKIKLICFISRKQGSTPSSLEKAFWCCWVHWERHQRIPQFYNAEKGHNYLPEICWRWAGNHHYFSACTRNY